MAWARRWGSRRRAAAARAWTSRSGGRPRRWTPRRGSGSGWWRTCCSPAGGAGLPRAPRTPVGAERAAPAPWSSAATWSPTCCTPPPTRRCAMPSLPPPLRWSLGLVAALVLTAAAAPLAAPYDAFAQLDPEVSALRPPGTVLAAVHLAGGDWRLPDRARRTAAGGRRRQRLGRPQP